MKPASVPAQQARLILQTPLSDDEEQMPTLRLSRELISATESELDRDAAQQMWETLQLKPEDIMASRSQLRQAIATGQAATQQAQAAQAEVGQLQAKLQRSEDARWQHPAVYGASAALLGVGWLWLSERKKRIAAQHHADLLQTEEDSVLAMPEGPSPTTRPSAIEPQLGLASLSAPSAAAASAASVAQPISDPIAQHIRPENLLPAIATDKAVAPVFESPPPWWKFGKRKAAGKSRRSALSGTDLDSSETYNSTQTQLSHFDLEAYEGTSELADMHPPEVTALDSELAHIELFTPARRKGTSANDAMGHLLELRMAVQALVVLGKPSAALKLLAQHIDEMPNTCAWAYMEYLDLSSIVGQRDAFESMRKRYRLQFNRLAPYWMEPNGSVQGLESYERAMADLCAAWPSLESTKELITTWLQGTLHARRLFQRPAYHDLFDLYEMLEYFDDEPSNAQDFVQTVSLLELDYEFAVEVKIQPQTAEDSLSAVPTVKTGDFDVDFNLSLGATDMGELSPVPDSPQAARPH